jgi:hypothetical protein
VKVFADTSLEGMPTADVVRVQWSHPSLEPGFPSQRTITKRDDGSIAIHNDTLVVAEKDRGKGLGSAIFARQVENAQKQGVARLETLAEKSPTMTGYKVWPRMGYDAPLPLRGLPERPLSLQHARRVSDLMKTEEGRTWWDANGVQLEMAFDLNPDSLSMKVHQSRREKR